MPKVDTEPVEVFVVVSHNNHFSRELGRGNRRPPPRRGRVGVGGSTAWRILSLLSLSLMLMPPNSHLWSRRRIQASLLPAQRGTGKRHLHLTARGAWCNIGVSVQGTQGKSAKGDRHLPSYPGIGCLQVITIAKGHQNPGKNAGHLRWGGKQRGLGTPIPSPHLKKEEKKRLLDGTAHT